LGGVEGRGFQPAVVKGETFRLAIFQKQLSIIGPGQRVIDDSPHFLAVKSSAVVEKLVGGG